MEQEEGTLSRKAQHSRKQPLWVGGCFLHTGYLNIQNIIPDNEFLILEKQGQKEIQEEETKVPYQHGARR